MIYFDDGLAGHSLGDGLWQCIEERNAASPSITA